MGLSGSAVAQRDDVVAGDDIFAARQLQRQRLIERGNGREVERIEALHRGKAGGPDATLDHAAFAIDEFEFDEAQQEAHVIETLARGLGGDFLVFAQERRQLQLSQMMREQHTGWRGAVRGV